MKQNGKWSLVLSLCTTLICGTSHALPFPNPAPGFFADDIDGTGLYDLGVPSFAFEASDLGASIDPGLGASFGFYFASDTSTLIEIFDTTDQDPGAAASIDLNAGAVFDADESAVQSTFTPGSGPVGFYINIASDVASVLGLPITIFYTDASLNFGIDVFGAFPLVSDSTSLFLSASIGNGTGGLIELGSYLLTNITPAPVPEPPVTMLLLTALAGLFIRRTFFSRK